MMQRWKVKRFKQSRGGQEIEMVNFGYLRDLTPPNDSVKIWRFMDLPKFLSIIQSKALYFARADHFEDPFEGARGHTGDEGVYINALVEALRDEFDSLRTKEPVDNETLTKYAKDIISAWRYVGFDKNHMYNTFVSCWHRNDVESDAMWRLYTKDLSQGIAIQTTCGRLRNSFVAAHCPGPVVIAPVEYIDYSLPLGLCDNPCWFKKESFKHENEIRAVVQFDYKKEEDSPIGRNVPSDPSVLIENIYVSPTAQPWFVKLVKDVVGKYGYVFNVVQSRLLDKGFR